MATYKTPGVYVEEITTLPVSVAQVATAIPAFVGYTDKNPSGVHRIKSMADYIDIFGGPSAETADRIEINISGTDVATAAFTSVTAPSSPDRMLYYHMQMYFANGGGPCYVASTGLYATAFAQSHFTDALDLIKKEDEPTMLVFPDAQALGTEDNFAAIASNALAQCASLGDRFTILDIFHRDGTIAGDIDNGTSGFRTKIGTQNLKYGAAYYPQLNCVVNIPETAIVFNTTVTALNGLTLEAAKESANTTVIGVLAKLGGDIAKGIGNTRLTLSPSSSIAGIYANVDRNRGVWKAPANVSINNVVEPTLKLTDGDQEGMNVDTTAGKSVNAIRFFTGKGNIVWGARTLAGNDNEWRYVPVRRLFNTVEESIQKSTAHVVFEPNDANTWLRVKTMIENYLSGLWRQGALAGSTPEQAFFVNVGLGSTMTATDILEGRMIIEIGMAAVRPAEFIILRFSHKLQEA